MSLSKEPGRRSVSHRQDTERDRRYDPYVVIRRLCFGSTTSRVRYLLSTTCRTIPDVRLRIVFQGPWYLLLFRLFSYSSTSCFQLLSLLNFRSSVPYRATLNRALVLSHMTFDTPRRLIGLFDKSLTETRSTLPRRYEETVRKGGRGGYSTGVGTGKETYRTQCRSRIGSLNLNCSLRRTLRSELRSRRGRDSRGKE